MSMLEKSIYVFLISLLPIVELRGAIPVGAALGLPFYVYAPLSVLGNLLPVPFILLFIPKILDLLERVRFLRPIVQWVRRKAHKGAARILEEKAADENMQTEPSLPEPDQGVKIAPETDLSENESNNAPDLPVDSALTEVARTASTLAEDATSAAAPTEEEAACAASKSKMSPGIFLALLFFVMIPLPGTGAWTGALVASLFDLPKRPSLLAITLGVLGACVIMTLASEGVVSIFRLFL